MAIDKVKGTDLQQAMPKANAKEPDYETEDNLRTMHKAADIMGNRPALNKVHKLAGRRHAALQALVEPALKPPKAPKPRSIQDLKDRASKMNAPQDSGDDEADDQ